MLWGSFIKISREKQLISRIQRLKRFTLIKNDLKFNSQKLKRPIKYTNYCVFYGASNLIFLSMAKLLFSKVIVQRVVSATHIETKATRCFLVITGELIT